MNDLLKNILEHSSNGMAVLSGSDLIFRVANPAFRQLLGITGGIAGKSYRQVLPKEAGYPEEDALRGAALAEQPVHFNLLERAVSPCQMQACRVDLGSETGVLLVITQIAESRPVQNERAGKAGVEVPPHAEDLANIIMALAEVVLIFGADGQVIHTNTAGLDVFGIDPVGMSIAELGELLNIRSPDGLPLEQNPLAFALQGNTINGQQVVAYDKHGEERIFLVSAAPLIRDLDVKGMVSVWHDVTSQERLLEQVEIEQSRLETIIRTAPQAILVADEEGRLVLANPEAERLLARPLPYGQDYVTLEELQICYIDGQPYTARMLPLVCAALDGTRQSNEELMVKLPDGQRRNVLSSTAPIIDRKGNLNGAITILQDITLRKRTEDELRTQAARSQMLASLSQAFAETGLNHRESLDTIVREIGGISGDICMIQLVAEDGPWTTIEAFFHPVSRFQEQGWKMIQRLRLGIDEFEASKVNRSGQVMRLVDASDEEIVRLFPAACRPVMALSNVRNGLIVPLRAHGRWIGSLGIFRPQDGGRYTMEDQFFYQDLADRAALAIEDARLFEQEARRAREMQALHRATTALLETIDLELLLVQILDAAQLAIPAAGHGALYLFSPGTGSLEIRAISGFRDPRIIKVSIMRIQQHAAQAVRERRSLLLNAISEETDQQGKGQSTRIRSAIIAPLMIGERVLGALSLTSAHADQFHPDDLRLLDSFAATATAALHNATLYAEVQRLATTDTLTEQFNRRRFFELGEMEMHRFRRFSKPLSAIMLDLDNFKLINDRYGHATGDTVLCAVARRIRQSIRVIDILGRYGGDEFAILLPDATIEQSREIAERIRQSVIGEEIYNNEGQAVSLSISLGIAQASDDNDNLSALMGRADSALYQAKQSGRNRVVEYHDS